MNKIENKLRVWFNEMVNRYNWLCIKYEYRDDYNTYLVSFSPVEKISTDNNFIEDAIDFENKMNMEYGDDAPLFCDEEKYFKLSESAETISCCSFKDNFTIAKEVKLSFEMKLSTLYTDNYFNYLLAA